MGEINNTYSNERCPICGSKIFVRRDPYSLCTFLECSDGHKFSVTNFECIKQINRSVENNLKPQTIEAEQSKEKELLIIQCDVLLSDEKFKRVYTDIMQQKENGLIILPSYMKVIQIAEDVDVRINKASEENKDE